MTYSICFMGNSHLVAHKLAWDDIKSEHSDYQIEMFGAAMEWLWETEYSEGNIAPTSRRVAESFAMTSGKEAIRLDQYDAFCVVACGIDSVAIADRIVHHAVPGSRTPGEHLVSRECFETAMIDVFDGSLAAALCRMIRNASSAPIFIFPQPFRSESVTATGQPKFAALSEVVHHGDQKLVSDIFDSVCDAFSKQAGASIVEQPAETRVQWILTKATYNENAIRLQPGFDKKHRRNDGTHMNKEFGIHAMRAFLEKLENKLAIPPASRA